MTIPDRLSAALSSRQPRAGTPEHRPTARRGVSRGDIHRVMPCFQPNGPGRFALILNVDSDEESVEIVLVHPYIELATETDLIFTPDKTDTPYAVIVQTEIRSAVWTLQTDERVGSLSEEALDEFGRVAVSDDPFTTSPRTGLPLAGPIDYRWGFKLQEIETLNYLAADRIFTALEGGLHPQWWSLSPSSQDSAVDELVANPSEWTMDELEALSKTDAFNPDAWADSSERDLDRDSCNSYQPSLDRVLADAA